MRRSVLKLLLLIYCVGYAMPFARAFVLLGKDWSYLADPMGENFIICTAGANALAMDRAAAVVAAAQAWTNDPALFSFTFGPNACNPAPKLDGVNQIAMGELPSNRGAETYSWSTRNHIAEVDIVFNNASNWSTATPPPAASVDFESAALHELGHALGLDHAPPAAIMQRTIGAGVQRRSLHWDDQAGIRSIYGQVLWPVPKQDAFEPWRNLYISGVVR